MFDLKRFRKDKKLTQQALDDILKCGQAYISQIENYKRPLPPEYEDILKEKFGDISGYNIDEIPQKAKSIKHIPDNVPSVPYEFVQLLFDERKKHDEKEAELLSQNRILLEIIKKQSEVLKISPHAPGADDAECAAVSGTDLKK